MKKLFTLIKEWLVNFFKYKKLNLLFVGFFWVLGFMITLPASAQSSASMVVENADKFPAMDELVFSNIQTPWRRKNPDGTYTPYNENHNKVKLRISNKGTKALVISKFTLSNTSGWKITLPAALPITINPGNTTEATIEFKARDQADRIKILHDKLTISSNDAATPTKTVLLNGLWQRLGEGKREPYAQEIINTFGYTTKTGYSHDDGTIDGNSLVPDSDEILAPFFVRASSSLPVTVVQMAAYHGCCASTENFKWYSKGTTASNTLFTHNALDGQTLLPRKRGSTTELAQGSFNPSTAFGIIMGTSYSDRTRNYKDKIGIRIWKAIDAKGNLIPNAYIMAMDYLGTPFVNYDYNDNMYFISNVKPDGTSSNSELAATRSTVDFGSVLAGSSKTISVNLKNLGRTGDPGLKITSVAIAGANASEFRAAMPATTTLAPQASTNASVSFRPGARGIKNTDLLVYYSTSSVPLRIPLYGIANDGSYTISIIRRIKAAADANVTISGIVWEADRNYRKGSIKLDKQVSSGPIAGTDQDVLYQTYLSAATNLAETREEIPIANGTYYVRLYFVENYFSAVNARVFNINIEGQTRLTGLDIYKEVGYRTALVKDFETIVKDGTLTLKFNPTANRVALAGIKIFKATARTASSDAVIAQKESAGLLNAEQKIRQLKVYPNPNPGNVITIEATNFDKHETITFTLQDILGKIIQVNTIQSDDFGTAISQMNLNQRLKPGVYILRGQAAAGETQAKVLVE